MKVKPMSPWMVVPSLGSGEAISDCDKPSSTKQKRSKTTMQSIRKPRSCSLGTRDAAEVEMGHMYVDRSTLLLSVVMKLLIASRSEGRM